MRQDRAHVVTLRQVIKSVPARWRETYNRPGYGPEKMRILSKLETLDTETCSAEDIAKIIGNNSWTRFVCDGCDQSQDSTLRISDEAASDARWQDLCLACLQDTIKILTEGSKI